MPNFNRRKRHQILLQLKHEAQQKFPNDRKRQKEWLAVERTALNVFRNDLGPKRIYLSLAH